MIARLATVAVLLGLTAPAFAGEPRHAADAGATDAGPALDLADAAIAAPAEARADVAPPKHAPVVFRGETLFDVRAPLGKLSIDQRAAAIVERLDRAALEAQALTVRLAGTDVLVDDRIVLSVTAADAAAADEPRAQLAQERLRRIDAALERDRRDRSVRGVLLGVGYSAGTTLALVTLLWLVSRGFARFEALLVRVSARQLDRRAAWLDRKNIIAALSALARLVRRVVVVVLVLVYVNLVLDYFPWTRDFAVRIFGYLRSALAWAGSGVIGYLPNVAYIAVTVVVVRFILQLARVIFTAIEQKQLVIAGFYQDWAEPSYKIARFLVLALSAVIIFPYLPGSQSPAFRGISVFLGVLFSLGSASSVGNLMSGVVITYMRPFQIGDRVQLADTIGDLVEKNLLVVRVRTIKNVEVTIPNALVLGNHIVNFSAPTREGTLIVHTSVTIGYDAPWRQVHELLMAAAARTDGLLAEPAPYVLQRALDDFYVEYEINAHTRNANLLAPLLAHLHENIQDAFNQAGVEIMSPHFTAARDGNRTAIPDENLPTGYEPSGFFVRTTPRKPRP